MSVLPIHNTIVVPDSTTYFKADHYRALTGREPVLDSKVVLIVAKEPISLDRVTPDSFYRIGITGVITEVSPQGFISIRLKNRVDIGEIYLHDGRSIDLDITRRGDIDDLDREDAERRLNEVKEAVLEFAQGMPWAQVLRGYAAHWTNIGEMAAAMSPWLPTTNEECYALLSEDSAQKRLDLTEKLLRENLELMKVGNEVRTAQEEDHQKLYRESAIKKQLEYLQNELDEMHPENSSDLQKLEQRLQEAPMNEDARKECGKILSRLKQEGKSSPEYGMLYDYLELMAGLPWRKEDSAAIDLDRAEAILDEDHFGLDKVKRRIIQQIAVMNLKRKQSGSILLFVGAPGTGKTSIGQSIARALDRKYVRVSLGGVRDEADIRGHRRTYIGSMPGRIMDGIHKSGVSNPVMVLDEVDKLSASFNGSPANALLEVLDPEQNNSFTDHYMNVPYDLSDVLFICTANALDTIPQPLLDRMELIQFTGYTPLEKLQIAREHLVPKSMEAMGIAKEQMTVTDAALETLISDYTMEAGVRGMKFIDAVCDSSEQGNVWKRI